MEVDTMFFKHSSGTKVYEMVLLSHKGMGFLIKRYGPVRTHRLGTGQTRIERGSTRAMNAEMRKMALEKEKTRAGGAYERRKNDWVLNGAPPLISWEEVKSELSRHYADSEVRAAVISYFRFLDGEEVSAVIATTPSPAPPVPEPVRSASWGSW